jgi:Region found in RelA / SpoT proteins
MPRPLSGNQLGKRLAGQGPISDEDYELLAQVAEFYQAVTDAVQERLRSLGFEPTTRGFKSTGTLVDKLRRTKISLKDIQDLGGARIVIDGGRLDQDRAVDRIMESFQDCPKPPLEIDRREKPSHGYRAVHVIVYEDSTPMEIQVRTKLQDTWAQISEKLGDMWGRGLRYGEGPNFPDSPAEVGSLTTRAEVVEQLLVISVAIDRNESNEVTLTQLREEMLELDPADRGNLPERLDAVAGDVAASKNTLQDALDRLLSEIGKQGGAS